MNAEVCSDFCFNQNIFQIITNISQKKFLSLLLLMSVNFLAYKQKLTTLINPHTLLD